MTASCLGRPRRGGSTVLSPQGRSTIGKSRLPYCASMDDGPSLPPRDRETKRRLPELLAARSRLRGRQPLLPHEGAIEGEQRPGVGKSGSLRAGIFGVNDGLVSNVALIMGSPVPTNPRA